MEAPTEVQQIEVSIEELQAKIALAEALDILHRSTAFKKVFVKEYFEKKAKNLVSMYALPQNEMQKELVQNGMIGISSLQSFFRSIYKDGDEASQALAEYQQEHAVAIAEGEAS